MATLSVGPNSTYPSIAAAMADAAPNDTILLEPGYANETATVLYSGMIIEGGAGSTGIVLELAMGIATVTLAGDAPFTVIDAFDGQGIVGNDGDNLITVTAGVDAVSGGLGEDRLIVDYRLATGAITGDSTSNVAESGGGARLVTINGGFEHLTVWTGSGADTITTGAGDDDIRTGEGASTVVAGEGANYIVGGSGADTVTAGDGGNYVDGGDGANVITTGAGADRILTGLDADTIDTGAGNDRITVLGGADTIIAGGGADLLIIDYASAITNVTGGVTSGDLAGGHVGLIADLALASADFTGVERFWITTGSGADLVTTGDGADILSGNGGDDDLRAAGGNDIVNGGDGDDLLDGGAGSDKLFGDGGGDVLTGGAGLDRMDGGDGIDLLSGGADNDYLDGGTGADVLEGGLGNDVYLIDDVGDLAIEGLAEGYDIVRTDLGGWVLGANIEALQLQGSADIDGAGNSGANKILGNAGANRLDGDVGVDTIDGGDGADTIVGGLGGDHLRGGAGADTFLVAHAFVAGLETDRVYDFNIGEGDLIDLSGVDANVNLDGDQDFTLVSAFSKVAGQMTLGFADGVTTLRLDTNGDGRPDYQMKLDGDVTSASGDWLF